jgi:hypothetical protein
MSTAVPRRTGVVGLRSRLNIGAVVSSEVSEGFRINETSVEGVSFSLASFSGGVALPEVEPADAVGKLSMCPDVTTIPHSLGCNFSHWLMDHANTEARNLYRVGVDGLTVGAEEANVNDDGLCLVSDISPGGSLEALLGIESIGGG